MVDNLSILDSNMKKYIFKIAIFFAIFALLDALYGKACEYLREQAQGGSTYDDKYVCDSTTQDILVFGSSRARHQYVPTIIQDSLDMTCYNCGAIGMGIIFHYGRMRVISQRYIPKVILYDVLPVLDEMERDDNAIFINPLRPHYDINGIDSIFNKIDPTEKYKMLSNTYKYHSNLFTYLSDYRNSSHTILGYNPQQGVIQKGEKIEEKTDYKVDSLKLYYLERFIQEYNDKTKIIFLASPRYQYENSGNAFDPLISLCKKYDIPFLNYYNDKRFIYDEQFYKDATHFNQLGAETYTRMIIGDLRKIIYK